MKSRGFRDERIKPYVGFNSGYIHKSIQCPKDWNHGAYKKVLEKAGILIPYVTRGYRPWAGRCLIFPLKNRIGEIVSFYGRSITDTENSRHFYLKNRSGLYPGYPDVAAERLILTESVLDALSLVYAGIVEPVLALYGTNGLSEKYIQAIKELKTSKPNWTNIIHWDKKEINLYSPLIRIFMKRH